MKKHIKSILPYLITTIAVIVFWKIWTETDNYAFNPKGKEVFQLDIALSIIFLYKVSFWLILSNLIVFTVRQFIRKKRVSLIVSLILTVIFYFSLKPFVDKKCAPFYYTVFVNQSVSEGYITRVIKEAGYEIGPLLTEKIQNKQLKYRRYAISGLGKIKYKPATLTLENILLDSTETDYFRADAYDVLKQFDTKESKKIIDKFKAEASSNVDKKVLKLIDN